MGIVEDAHNPASASKKPRSKRRVSGGESGFETSDSSFSELSGKQSRSSTLEGVEFETNNNSKVEETSTLSTSVNQSAGDSSFVTSVLNEFDKVSEKYQGPDIKEGSDDTDLSVTVTNKEFHASDGSVVQATSETVVERRKDKHRHSYEITSPGGGVSPVIRKREPIEKNTKRESYVISGNLVEGIEISVKPQPRPRSLHKEPGKDNLSSTESPKPASRPASVNYNTSGKVVTGHRVVKETVFKPDSGYLPPPTGFDDTSNSESETAKRKVEYLPPSVRDHRIVKKVDVFRPPSGYTYEPEDSKEESSVHVTDSKPPAEKSSPDRRSLETSAGAIPKRVTANVSHTAHATPPGGKREGPVRAVHTETPDVVRAAFSAETRTSTPQYRHSHDRETSPDVLRVTSPIVSEGPHQKGLGTPVRRHSSKKTRAPPPPTSGGIITGSITGTGALGVSKSQTFTADATREIIHSHQSPERSVEVVKVSEKPESPQASQQGKILPPSSPSKRNKKQAPLPPKVVSSSPSHYKHISVSDLTKSSPESPDKEFIVTKTVEKHTVSKSRPEVVPVVKEVRKPQTKEIVVTKTVEEHIDKRDIPVESNVPIGESHKASKHADKLPEKENLVADTETNKPVVETHIVRDKDFSYIGDEEDWEFFDPAKDKKSVKTVNVEKKEVIKTSETQAKPSPVPRRVKLQDTRNKRTNLDETIEYKNVQSENIIAIESKETDQGNKSEHIEGKITQVDEYGRTIIFESSGIKSKPQVVQRQTVNKTKSDKTVTSSTTHTEQNKDIVVTKESENMADIVVSSKGRSVGSVPAGISNKPVDTVDNRLVNTRDKSFTFEDEIVFSNTRQPTVIEREPRGVILDGVPGSVSYTDEMYVGEPTFGDSDNSGDSDLSDTEGGFNMSYDPHTGQVTKNYKSTEDEGDSGITLVSHIKSGDESGKVMLSPRSDVTTSSGVDTTPMSTGSNELLDFSDEVLPPLPDAPPPPIPTTLPPNAQPETSGYLVTDSDETSVAISPNVAGIDPTVSSYDKTIHSTKGTSPDVEIDSNMNRKTGLKKVGLADPVEKALQFAEDTEPIIVIKKRTEPSNEGIIEQRKRQELLDEIKVRKKPIKDERYDREKETVYVKETTVVTQKVPDRIEPTRTSSHKEV